MTNTITRLFWFAVWLLFAFFYWLIFAIMFLPMAAAEAFFGDAPISVETIERVFVRITIYCREKAGVKP